LRPTINQDRRSREEYDRGDVFMNTHARTRRSRLATLVIPSLALASSCATSPEDAVDRWEVAATPLVCSGTGPLPADPKAAARDSCTFAAGAAVASSVGDVTDLRNKIKHYVVLMQENRSLDHMFGKTGHGIEGIPAGTVQNDTDGTPIAPFHAPNACLGDIDHQWDAMHVSYNGGHMDRFVVAERGGHTPVFSANALNTMAYYEDADHPFYTWLATTFATGDRYFASVLGPTWPNRDYFLAGRSYGPRTLAGRTGTGVLYENDGFPSTPTIFDQLDAKGIHWVVYVEAGPTAQSAFEGALGEDWRAGFKRGLGEVRDYKDFASAVKNGTLPPVTFIHSARHDEHPSEQPDEDVSIPEGERFVRTVVTQVMSGPAWPDTAVLLTYDESGGFYDHVAPPSACPAGDEEAQISPVVNVPPERLQQAAVDRLGFRVPVFVVSPWSRPGYVSHATHSHTSMLRLIQATFDLPALSRRDANSDAMLDMFDFSCPHFATPPAQIPLASVVPDCGDVPWPYMRRFANVQYPDINGDGRADVCRRQSDGIHCWLSNGSGFPTHVVGPAWSDANGWWRPEHALTIRWADINGDGKADVCGRDTTGIQCYLSTGTGFGSKLTGPSAPDASGWDRPEYYSTIAFADVDGDKKADYCARSATGVSCLLSNGSNFLIGFPGPAASDANGWNHPEYYLTIQFPDIDGDGRADYCGRASDGIGCYLWNGSRFATPVIGPAATDAAGWAHPQYYLTIQYPQLNSGDRAADLCSRSVPGIGCYYANGSGFVNGFNGPAASDANGWADPRYYPTIGYPDIDGDKNADFCSWSSQGMGCYRSVGGVPFSVPVNGPTGP
jgi:phospholipase C